MWVPCLKYIVRCHVFTSRYLITLYTTDISVFQMPIRVTEIYEEDRRLSQIFGYITLYSNIYSSLTICRFNIIRYSTVPFYPKCSQKTTKLMARQGALLSPCPSVCRRNRVPSVTYVMCTGSSWNLIHVTQGRKAYHVVDFSINLKI